MAVFRLKTRMRDPRQAIAGAVAWNYDRAELVADGVVHGLGVGCGLVAATALVTLTGVYASPSDVVTVSIYVAGLLAMLGLSAAYNLWPVSPVKWRLRRFDHSAIYVLIAATYTPFMLQVKHNALALGLLVGLWCVAATGVVVKVVFPGRFDRLSVGLYLLMGWSGVMIYDQVVAALSDLTLTLIVVGGVLYTLGVIFHVWQRLRFQNAIWHAFVLLGAGCHYSAVLGMVLA